MAPAVDHYITIPHASFAQDRPWCFINNASLLLAISLSLHSISRVTVPCSRMATATTANTTLRLLHFNDVYRVTPQKISAGSNDTFDVTQFAWLVDDLRSKWPLRDQESEEGKEVRDGLLLFSGDVFSPSMESSVTRGSHMVSGFEINQDAESLTGRSRRSRC